MLQNFEPNTEIYSAPPGSLNKSNANREPVRIILVGSAMGINLIIKILHRLGFAEVGDWSKPQAYPNSDKLMSILTKWIRH
ncbi:MAG: hypothetical protein F6J97_20010 [Leptolyngbya sp. SIO4C1]|nr:hypothetical protein [Leptolyngbya sp. SIO4C1]